MGTQWQVGMGGATGLVYASLPVVFRLQRLPRNRWTDVFEDVRVMESEALKSMAEKRERDK